MKIATQTSSNTTAADASIVIYLGTALPSGATLYIDDVSFKPANSLNGALPAISDFATPAGSPAVDAGVALTGVTDDFLGSARPSGGGYDIGAYER